MVTQTAMTGRERVRAAMRYEPVDKAPLQYHYGPVGFYEHGEALNTLYERHTGDFQPFVRCEIPKPPPEDFEADGSYHAFRRDDWGTLWEYRIFGVAGLPVEYPANNETEMERYIPPDTAEPDDATLARERAATAAHKERYYALHGGGSLFERLKSLCPDEEVLINMALESSAFSGLADRVAFNSRRHVELAVARGADGISFGDDYGAERGMLISPEMWRRFIKPRLKVIFQPAVDAGLNIVFHSCGQIWPILEDLREVGATAVWPQLPAYDMGELAARCRSLKLAVAIHTDRANTMTFGTPGDVRELVKREYDAFRMWEGGSWFYVEADNDFPYANLEALVETIAQWR